MKTRIAVLAAAAASLALIQSACEAESPSGGTDDPPVVSFSAHDFKYDGPASVAAGMTDMRITNNGKEPHQIQLIKTPADRTLEEVAAAMAVEGEGEVMPDWIELAGGPNGAEPGATSSAFVELEPGHYAITCLIPSKDGVVHAAKGMLSEFSVTEVGQTTASAPAPEITIAAKEFAFGVEGELTAGSHVVNMTDMGEQAHEAFLVRLNEGTSATEYLAAFSPEAQGPPPGALAGGIGGIVPGTSQSFNISLVPGRYAFICAFPDPDTGMPHAAVGMYHEFEVGD
jgi:hypothetical protein